MAVLTIALQALLYSTLATDRLQSQYWILGTPEKPYMRLWDCQVPENGIGTACRYAWVSEANPLVAGRPKALNDFVVWLRQAGEAAPEMLPNWAAIGGMAWMIGEEAKSIIHNDAYIGKMGWPHVYMMAYQFHF